MIYAVVSGFDPGQTLVSYVHVITTGDKNGNLGVKNAKVVKVVRLKSKRGPNSG